MAEQCELFSEKYINRESVSKICAEATPFITMKLFTNVTYAVRQVT